MEFYGTTTRRGHVAVTAWRYNESTGLWERGWRNEYPNLVVNGGLDLLARAVESNAVDTQITYLALGSSATAAAATDTALGSEQFRKQVTAYTTGITTGEVTVTTYIAPGEANAFTINEFGWFAEDATGTANSGTMVARVVQNETKNNTIALQIDRTDTFS